ncbi:hypothetical protein ABLE92_12270 [Gordonia sp. VNQ95]|uniref:hypothetical protein n=1 Tax=Gordonia sp. VNQ95 TaxID=3156619 RepID=UPI0032B3CE7D
MKADRSGEDITRDGKGFFTTPAPAEDSDNHRHVAYRWGDMTSGLAVQALWALFVPFALVNVATWMLPAPRDSIDRGLLFLARASFRLIGLAMTALVMVQLTILFADVVLTQCVSLRLADSSTRCWDWLQADWAEPRGTEVRSWLVFIIIIAILAVGGVLAMSIDHDRDLRGCDNDGHTPPTAGIPQIASDDFVKPRDARAPTLLTTHAMIAIVTPAVFLAGGFHGYTALKVACLVLGGIAIVVTVLCDDPRGSGGTYTWGGPDSRLRIVWRWFGGYRSMFWIGFSTLGLAIVTGWILPDRMATVFTQSSEISTGKARTAAHGLGNGEVVTYILIAAAALTTLCVLLVLYLHRSPPGADPRPYGRAGVWLFGFHAPCVAAIAVLLGAGAGVALTRVAAGVITTDPTEPQDVVKQVWSWITQSVGQEWISQSGFTVPETYTHVAWAWGAVVIGAGCAIAVLLIIYCGIRGKERNRLNNELMPKDSRRWRFQAALAEAKLHIPQAIGLITLAFLVVGAIELFRPGWITSSSWLQTVGIIALFVAEIALLWSIYNAIRKPRSAGRNLGVLWDLASFWPREAHPLVPPAYAPRAIRDLESYATLEDLKDSHLVLCGHSQGSLLMYAVAHRLASFDKATDVSLLTYGSQLGWAYGRAFPSALDHNSMKDLGNGLGGRWINLARFTDYLGDGVFSAVRRGGMAWYGRPGREWNPQPNGVRVKQLCFPEDGLWISSEVWLPDPSGQEWPGDRTRQHSGYTSDPTWDQWIAELTSGPIPQPSPSGPTPPGSPLAQPNTATPTAGSGPSTPGVTGGLPGNPPPPPPEPTGAQTIVFLGGLASAGEPTCTAEGFARNLLKACTHQFPDSGTYGPTALSMSYSTTFGDPQPITKLTLAKPTQRAPSNQTSPGTGTTTTTPPAAGTAATATPQPPSEPPEIAAIYDLKWASALIDKWHKRNVAVRILSLLPALMRIVPFLRFFTTAGRKNTLGRTQLIAASLMVVALAAYFVLLVITALMLFVAAVRGAAASNDNPGQASTSQASSPTAAPPPTTTTEQAGVTEAAATSAVATSSPTTTSEAATQANSSPEASDQVLPMFDTLWQRLMVGTSVAGGVILTLSRQHVARLLRSGEILAIAQSYLNLGDGQGTSAAQLTDLISEISKKEPEREITIVAYSFGALVAIDTLFPTSGEIAILSKVKRLVTIGAPFDFARAFKPIWHTTQRYPTDFTWINMYANIDLLGSNFSDQKDPLTAELGMVTPPATAASSAAGSSLSGSPYTLRWDIEIEPTFMNLLAFYGFQSHTMYWSEDATDRNALTLAVPYLIPPG